MANMDVLAQKTGIRKTVLDEIVSIALKYDVKKVVLFGSRARGDYKRTSDIDLAVDGGNFSRFAIDVDEDTSTLLTYDVIDLGRNMQKELLDAIRNEGVVIYEKV